MFAIESPLRLVRGATFLWIGDLCCRQMLICISGKIGSLADSRAKFFTQRKGAAARYSKGSTRIPYCGAESVLRAVRQAARTKTGPSFNVGSTQQGREHRPPR